MPNPGPGFVEASYIHSADGSANPLVCVWGHDISDFTPVNGAPLAESLKTRWVQHVMAAMSDQVKLQEVAVRVGQDGAPTIETFPGGGAEGQMESPMLPPNCATLVKKNTGLGGRQGRGRCYLPPMAESQVDGGRIVPSAVTTVQTALNAWQAALVTIGVTLVLLHSTAGLPVSPTPITSLSVDSLLATQRRRLR